MVGEGVAGVEVGMIVAGETETAEVTETTHSTLDLLRTMGTTEEILVDRTEEGEETMATEVVADLRRTILGTELAGEFLPRPRLLATRTGDTEVVLQEVMEAMVGMAGLRETVEGVTMAGDQQETLLLLLLTVATVVVLREPMVEVEPGEIMNMVGMVATTGIMAGAIPQEVVVVVAATETEVIVVIMGMADMLLLRTLIQITTTEGTMHLEVVHTINLQGDVVVDGKYKMY